MGRIRRMPDTVMNFVAPNLSIDSSANDVGPERTAGEAVALATRLLEAAHREQNLGERREAAQMARLMDDVAGKAFLFAMVD